MTEYELGVIDQGTRAELERLSGRAVPDADWPRLRQALRVHLRGQRVAADGSGRKRITPTHKSNRPYMENDVPAGVKAIADRAKADNCSVLEAARALIGLGAGG